MVFMGASRGATVGWRAFQPRVEKAMHKFFFCPLWGTRRNTAEFMEEKLAPNKVKTKLFVK
jgi:hypothetical protein